MVGNGAIGGFLNATGLNIGAGPLPNLMQLAQQAIAAHSTGASRIDFQGLAKTLQALSNQLGAPKAGGTGPTLRQTVDALLTPAQRGALSRESDTLATETLKTTATTAASATKEVQLDPKALGFSQGDFAAAMDKGHAPETRAAVAKMWAEGKNLPRVIVADLKTANASFDPSAGPNGTITLNAKLMNATQLSAGYGSFAAWGVMEEVGHWADRQAHILEGHPQGQTAGDEGARFAHAMQQHLPEGGLDRQMGFVAKMTLGTIDGKAVGFDYDRVVLKGLDAILSANGHMSAENKVGNVEMYHPDGHYVATFLNAMGVGKSLGMSDARIAPIAAELALGSQLPDMLAKFDALSLYESKKKQQAAELASTTATAANPIILGKKLVSGEPIRPVYWTPAEQAHLEKVYRGLHGMPANEGEATRGYLIRERAKTSAFIEARMKERDWLSAGVAIHRLADLHAHVDPNGRPYWGDMGHGHEDAKGKLAKGWGRSPDLLFYKANFDKFEKGYLPALQQTLSNGLKAAKLAQNNYSTVRVQLGATAYFRSMMESADADPTFAVRVTSQYDYNNLIKMEQNFVDFVAKAFNGQNIMNHQNANATGEYKASRQQDSKINHVMIELSKK